MPYIVRVYPTCKIVVGTFTQNATVTRSWYVLLQTKSSESRSYRHQRLTGSMPMHPLPAIMNHGVHVALCSDDPAAFGNMGLTFDFFQVRSLRCLCIHLLTLMRDVQVFVASEVNGLNTLRELVWDSIRVSVSCLANPCLP